MRQLLKFALVFLSVTIAVSVQAENQSAPVEADKKPDSESVKTEKQAEDHSAPVEADKKPDSESKTEKKQDLGMWWNKSPLSYDPMSTQFLYHFEAGYSFSRLEGSFTTDIHMANAKLTLRKHRLTNAIMYNLDKRNSAMANQQSISVDEQGNVTIGEVNDEIRNDKKEVLANYLNFALTERFFLGAGVEWTTDGDKQIKDRYLYFAGVGCRIIDEPKYFLRVLGAYGYQTLQYTDYYNRLFGGLVLKYNAVDKFDSGVLTSNNYYLSMDARWQVTDSLAFTHASSIVGDFEKKENRYNWRWTLAAGLAYRINKYVSLTFNFTEDYNKQPAIGVRKRGQSTKVGIQLEF